MEIVVYAMLRDVVGGRNIHLDTDSPITAKQLLDSIVALHPALSAKFFDKDGNLQRSFQILVNGRDLRHLSGLDTVVMPDDTVRIFPPVGGG